MNCKYLQCLGETGDILSYQFRGHNYDKWWHMKALYSSNGHILVEEYK